MLYTYMIVLLILSRSVERNRSYLDTFETQIPYFLNISALAIKLSQYKLAKSTIFFD